MAKPLDEFGGWLRFFQVVCVINVIVYPITCLIFLLAIVGEPTLKSAVECSLYIAESITLIVLFAKILTVIKVRAGETPECVIKLAFWIMVLSLAFLALEIPAVFWVNNGHWLKEDTGMVRGSLSMVFWYLVWSSYLRKSKRALAYYQSAPVQAAPGETSIQA